MPNRQRRSPKWLLLTLLLAVCPPLAVFAQPDPDAEPKDIVATTVVGGLTKPAGIAVRPGGGQTGNDLFIADSGARRIVSTSSAGNGKWTEVVTGFSGDELAGPKGLLFISRNTLLVSSGGILRGYDISTENLPIDASDTKMKSALADEEPGGSSGDLFGIARNSAAVFVVTNGKIEHEGILRATISATKLSVLKSFVDTRNATGGSRPRGIAFSKKGYLVVSQAGESDKPGDSLLGFYHPYDRTAAPALVLKTGLDDVMAIAYSPKTGDLFAIDFAEQNPESGGIYRIDAEHDKESGKLGCKAVLIANVHKPVALTFLGDGTLFVTTFGDQDGEGKLLKLSEKL
ncbi:MAG: hypothetical protein ACR2NU_04270 [Aeoliella sp.]